MTDTTEIDAPPESGSSKWLFVISLVLAIAGGGGGFYAVYSGLLLGDKAETDMAKPDVAPEEALPDIVYVPVDPIVVSLTDGGSSSHLRFRAQLEVPGEYGADVERILPRVVDVLNSYLRALNPADIEAPDALVRLRAQMLRRVQIVTGKGRVRDLLVMEFVLN